MSVVLGVTGDIGSGKSTVLRFLRELGAETLSADDLARDALGPGTPGAAEVAARFGPIIMSSDGNIDRKALADVVFGDEQARRDLEAIVHPVVLGIVADKVSHFRRKAARGSVLAVEVPLLFESGSEAIFDAVVTVVSEQERLISRLKQDRNLSRQEVMSRLAAQLPSVVKASRSQYVVSNDSDLATLRESVRKLWATIACPLTH